MQYVILTKPKSSVVTRSRVITCDNAVYQYLQIWCQWIKIPPNLKNYKKKINLNICGNKMPTRCNRSFYGRSYCLLNMFRVPLCPSSGAREYYTVVAACGIWCCGFQVVGLVWSWGLCVQFAGYCTAVYREWPDTRCCSDTICPPGDEHSTAWNMSRIIM